MLGVHSDQLFQAPRDAGPEGRAHEPGGEPEGDGCEFAFSYPFPSSSCVSLPEEIASAGADGAGITVFCDDWRQ